VVQAHPFRQHFYIRRMVLSAGCVDGVEAANAANHEQSYDALAMRYAQRLSLPAIAGTDLHDLQYLFDENAYGIYVNEKMRSIDDFVYAIRNNGISGIRTNKGRCDWNGFESVSIPVDIRDGDDQSTGKSWKDYI